VSDNDTVTSQAEQYGNCGGYSQGKQRLKRWMCIFKPYWFR